MRGAGDPRLQHPSGFAQLPSSCPAACAPRKETKSRIDFFQICLVYSLLWQTIVLVYIVCGVRGGTCPCSADVEGSPCARGKGAV